MTDKDTPKKYSVMTQEISGSRIEINGEIEWSEVEKHRAKSLKKLSQGVSIDGFRKGKVPENLLIKHVGEMAILSEMAEMSIQEHYPEILLEHAPKAIGRPQIVITKLAKDNPLGFKATTAVIPEVTLPDYKKIATKVLKKHSKPDTKVSDKELDDGVKEIRRQWALTEKMKSAQEKGESFDPRTETIPDKDLPELNDEMLKVLGDFKNVDEFKTRFKENMTKEKERKALEKKRVDLVESIVGETKLDVPEIIIEGEIDKMMSQFEGDVVRANLKIDDYLKHMNKTKEDLRNDWRPDAEKRAKTQFILSSIARAEEIKPDEDQLKDEMEKILNEHENADRFNVRMYLEQVMTNEKVLEFLEKEKN